MCSPPSFFSVHAALEVGRNGNMTNFVSTRHLHFQDGQGIALFNRQGLLGQRRILIGGVRTPGNNVWNCFCNIETNFGNFAIDCTFLIYGI